MLKRWLFNSEHVSSIQCKMPPRPTKRSSLKTNYRSLATKSNLTTKSNYRYSVPRYIDVMNYTYRPALLLVTIFLQGCYNTKPQKKLLDDGFLTSSNHCFTMTSNWSQNAVALEFFDAEFTFKTTCIPEGNIQKIDFNAEMPAHNHGMNSMPVKEFNAPKFTIRDIYLHMVGQWHVSLEIHYKTEKNTGYQMEVIEFTTNL